MVSEWRPISPPKRGTCIYNYNLPPDPENLWKLFLYLGDTVVILAETEEWYYGRIQGNMSKGMFPKSYVHLVNFGDELEPLVAETNATLKEWYEILKEKYKSPRSADQTSVLEIRGIHKEVAQFRSQLATMKLTEIDAKQTRSKLVEKTDFLNDMLGLDMVVRDENSRILEPVYTSAVSLFRHHQDQESRRPSNKFEMANLRQKSKVSVKENVNTGTNSFRIMCHMKSFDSPKITEDVDLIISIHDVDSEGRTTQICESFVIENWKKNAPSEEKEKLSSNLRVQFGDLSKNDITGVSDR